LTPAAYQLNEMVKQLKLIPMFSLSTDFNYQKSLTLDIKLCELRNTFRLLYNVATVSCMATWQQKCRHQAPRCARCGENHKLNECHQESMKCFHCSRNHLSFSKSCPRWKTEQEIVTLKHTLNLSFPEARKQIQQKTSILYASVATKSYKSSATQTELSMSSHTLPAPQTSTTPKTISQTDSQTKPSSETKTPSDLSFN